MELNDVLGFGKVLPLKKLLNVITKATGRAFKATFDRKDINTRIYELQSMSKAINENYQLTGGIEYKSETLTIKSPNELKRLI